MLNILFYLFSIFLLLSSLVIVFSYNSIVSVLFLILSFLISAILLLLLECEFLALLLITIYVGAVAVLFLFILMMLETKLTNLSKKLTLYFPFGIFVSVLFFFEVLFCVSESFEVNAYSHFFSFLRIDYCNWYSKIDSLTDVEVFGHILYTHFVLQFLMVGFLLFLALVGVVYLSVNSTERKSKNQAVFHQLSRNPTVY
jgi:NADH-quinone oxidoreductase subunit J